MAATGPTEVMMALGSYRFALSSAAYQELARQAAWRWPTLEPIGAAPLRQFTGRGNMSMTLTGLLYPHYKGLLGLPNLLARAPGVASALGTAAGINSALARVGLSPVQLAGVSGSWGLEGLRADADTGRALLLVDGRGRNWGYWVVEELQETETHHFADGAPRKLAFTVKLGWYGDEADDAVAGDWLDGVRSLLGI
jgi:phage protein U